MHVGLQEAYGSTLMASANSFVTDLHWGYSELFPDRQKRVQGWRMTVDIGKTLVVVGRGVHHDDSYVSLGKAANRPAKHLYAQMLGIRNEEDRQLKRYHVGIRRPGLIRDTWEHFDLDRSKSRLPVLKELAEAARSAEPKLRFLEAAGGWKQVTARAIPLAPAGTPGAPSPEKPHNYFGWVMRADLDGFSKRVEDCYDDDQALLELGQQFYSVMDEAAAFTERHSENLLQLPWAGDNFTAAAAFRTRDEYDGALPKRLIELTLDFEKDMCGAAVDCGCGGWAHGVAGGVPHGNARGNVYVAGIELDGRRFLVGVGEGFGRSTQAFADIKPEPTSQSVVVYAPDWARMHEPYKEAFEPAVTVRKEQSKLFYAARRESLVKVRATEAAANTTVVVSFTGEAPRTIPTRPHFR